MEVSFCQGFLPWIFSFVRVRIKKTPPWDACGEEKALCEKIRWWWARDFRTSGAQGTDDQLVNAWFLYCLHVKFPSVYVSPGLLRGCFQVSLLQLSILMLQLNIKKSHKHVSRGLCSMGSEAGAPLLLHFPALSPCCGFLLWRVEQINISKILLLSGALQKQEEEAASRTVY